MTDRRRSDRMLIVLGRIFRTPILDGNVIFGARFVGALGRRRRLPDLATPEGTADEEKG